MRDRKEIVKEAEGVGLDPSNILPKRCSVDVRDATAQRLTIELLLDIRDLLKEQRYQPRGGGKQFSMLP